MLLRARELRILGESGHWLGERAAQVEKQARTGRAVMPPPAQRLEQGIARQLGHQIAGEPADRAEGRCARTGGARSALVIVAVTHDADAVAALERIVEEPLERAPGRMDL